MMRVIAMRRPRPLCCSPRCRPTINQMASMPFQVDLDRYGPASEGAPAATQAESRAYCRELAHRHYENFHVASLLLPRPLRPHFHAVYAYCRWSDDLADEINNPQRSLELLDWWEAELQACYAGSARHPVFVALRDTIAEFSIPIEPFADLLVAFRRDQVVHRYETADDVLGYCRYSANPVGRLVLYLARAHDERRGALADAICTGLQLANFCQDVAGDWQRGRIYLPQAECRRFEYGEADFACRAANENFRRLLAGEVDRAAGYLRRGLPLVDMMPRGLRGDVWLFAQGGLAILERIHQVNYDVWQRRPKISRLGKLRLLAGAVRRNLVAGSASVEAAPVESLREASMNPDLASSYAHCQRIARRAAGNFYYSFLVLPRAKRRAMCALYAFLRATDDLGDSDRSLAERRDALAAWRRELTGALAGASDSAILPALVDTVESYEIPCEYLYDCITGVEMDLDGREYDTFADLEDYCYHVASVVGLACIHIWGFSDPAALEPARRLGIAFQLTNILRDLKEDSERGRVYLPREDLRRFGYTPEELAAGVQNASFRELMNFQIARADDYYRAGAALEPLLSRDSRAALRDDQHLSRAALRHRAPQGGCVHEPRAA